MNYSVMNGINATIHIVFVNMGSTNHIKIKSGKSEKGTECPFPLGVADSQYMP
jgi:hypothetical protein